MLEKDDIKYIKKCFSLAKKYQGHTSPNPLVGSVIIKNNIVLAKGFHKGAGSDHAELMAIHNALKNSNDKNILKGSTLYCNLEPCCHLKKRTPPCAQRIIKEGIKRVVISNIDPNPAVNQNGIKMLREAGIEVITGVLESEGAHLNRIFFHQFKSDLPYIHLKWAQTLDGKMATLSHHSKWITSEEARKKVHQERLLYDAILVGANTLKSDNPSLTVRVKDKVIKCPKRLIISKNEDFKFNLNLFTDQYASKTIILSPLAHSKLQNIKHIQCPSQADGRIDLLWLLKRLRRENIMSLYVEGGAEILSQFIQKELFNEVSCYVAAKILGAGLGLLNNFQAESMLETKNFKFKEITQLGEDLLLKLGKN